MSKKFTPSLDPFARSKKTASSPTSAKKVGEEGSLPDTSKLVVEQGGGGSSPKPVRSQSPTLVKSRSPSVEEEVELFPKPVVPVTTAPPIISGWSPSTFGVLKPPTLIVPTVSSVGTFGVPKPCLAPTLTVTTVSSVASGKSDPALVTTGPQRTEIMAKSLAAQAATSGRSWKLISIQKGHLVRSFRIQVKKLDELMQDVSDPKEDMTPNQRREALLTFQKIDGLAQQHEDLISELLSAPDCPPEKAEEATDQSIEVGQEQERIQKMMKGHFTNLDPPSIGLTEVEPSSLRTPVGQPLPSYDPILEPFHNLHLDEEEDVLVTRKFTGEDEESDVQSTRGKEESMMIRLLSLNYKISDHVPVFSGDAWQYTTWRASVEQADRVFTQQKLSDFLRFAALKTVLKGESLSLVKSLPALNSSYHTALKLLDDMYLTNDLSLKRIMEMMQKLSHQGTSYTSCRKFYCELVSIINAFSSLKCEEDSMGRSLFFQIVTPKLNARTANRFAEMSFRARDTKNPLGHSLTISSLAELVLFQMQVLAQTGGVRGESKEKQDKSDKKKKQKDKEQDSTDLKFFAVTNTKVDSKSSKTSGGKKKQKGKKDLSKTICNLCNKAGHIVKDCPTIKGKSTKDIIDLVSKLKLCKLCFSKNHKTSDCPSKDYYKCKHCPKTNHNSLLHMATTTQTSTPKVKSINYVGKQPNDYGKAIPNVLRVRAYGNRSGTNPVEINVFLDSGSNATLITANLAQLLKLKSTPVAGYDGTKAKGVNQTELTGIDTSKTYQVTVGSALYPWTLLDFDLTAYSVPYIDQVGPILIDPQDHSHLRAEGKFRFTIPLPHTETMPISLLLGEPWVSFITKSAPIKNPKLHYPHVCAIRTSLGDFLAGCHPPDFRVRRVRKINVGTSLMDAPNFRIKAIGNLRIPTLGEKMIGTQKATLIPKGTSLKGIFKPKILKVEPESPPPKKQKSDVEVLEDEDVDMEVEELPSTSTGRRGPRVIAVIDLEDSSLSSDSHSSTPPPEPQAD